ncbi:uncharacterized protein ARMOST_15835 [Armillaria ostoyae]|uniref:Uncharacterized protein n=1 Tax=Armillaria ostoyae TaxID=47428 RepID=A0A284RUG4_ARMOS|nr:uncharacterized protein ARMOST_15835 [Armillaria ostoyae]
MLLILNRYSTEAAQALVAGNVWSVSLRPPKEFYSKHMGGHPQTLILARLNNFWSSPRCTRVAVFYLVQSNLASSAGISV